MPIYSFEGFMSEGMTREKRRQMIVAKRVSFDAAHYLPKYEGKCNKLHGHRWTVEVAVEGRVHPDTGMVVDFAWLKEALEAEVIRRFDHTCLNDIFDNPTAENLADCIFTAVRNAWIQCPSERVQLAWVKVWETPNSMVMRGRGD